MSDLCMCVISALGLFESGPKKNILLPSDREIVVKCQISGRELLKLTFIEAFIVFVLPSNDNLVHVDILLISTCGTEGSVVDSLLQ